MGATKIPWADRVWNPVTGCTRVSEGCRSCYAHAMHARFDKGPFKVTFHADRLDEPLHWRKPSRVFVCSMGDLFHEDVHREWRTDIASVITRCPQHTFIMLTKRPALMREEWWLSVSKLNHDNPLSNLWFGVSVENQATADERIPILLQTPAAVRFVSAEPLLGPVDFRRVPSFNKCGSAGVELLRSFWVIAGAESGPGARPCDPSWVRSIIDQCKAAGVPLFVKQWREGGKLVKMPRIDGTVYAEFPAGKVTR